ncbi:translation initiation factor [Pigmentibacter sp. JX0631]|uniref:translation initiation factor n=1 Tax=Pigmentibacter sp. JX0631 TaxID=2976982 RepID=UPI002468D5F2|nr:translation initiation factor [Pigmentibacter sp. JX0631]WGL61288.1 translation initiation factor [Pigmentibacter sp. JX0631]
MTEKKKTKPIKLEWSGNIASVGQESPVNLKKSETKEEKKQPNAIQGKLKIRTETKGRAGKPVAILFNFSDPEAHNPESLKLLCSKLKTSLACGGTVENNEIVLTIREINKLKEVLKNFQLNSN